MAKSRVVLAGVGKIGEAIVSLLTQTGDYDVTIVEQDRERLVPFEKAGFSTHACALGDDHELAPVLLGKDAVISACPYFLTPLVARAARKAGVHYFDLTEDVESTRVVKKLAEGAETAFVPQCGLAPGFISIAAHSATLGFDSLRDVRMRVGALPIFPSNALKYNLTWSTDGLINEYCNPCEAIIDGAVREVPALEEREEFSLDGVTYEAFNTSGGLGTLCETLGGRVENLNYKTVRYPGHRDIVKILIRDLRLGQQRGVLKDVFEAAIPMTTQDLVIVFVTVTGHKEGRLTQETFVRKIYAKRVNGRLLSAIQLTTAAGICAMVDLQREGKLASRGFVRQEEASLEDFLANRFGRHYAGEAANQPGDHHGLADTRRAA
ncbi:MAG: saccharopine dehydrogenase NADP-binding domain-containing protein [Betaproteobacteria bacterium]|nr:saccharopine dehydrogenase NADP-binding domain-containing protein [Betaproteobacteria bacterium]